MVRPTAGVVSILPSNHSAFRMNDTCGIVGYLISFDKTGTVKVLNGSSVSALS